MLFNGPVLSMTGRTINKIVIHCTDSQDSLDIGFREINDWHKQRGWLGPKSGISCGYHYIIRKNGTVEQGRPVYEMGAHVSGHNSDSIGIVWVGRNDCTEKQYQSLLSVIKALCVKYELNHDDVFGHNELFSGKTCPNIDMNKIRAEILFLGVI